MALEGGIGVNPPPDHHFSTQTIMDNEKSSTPTVTGGDAEKEVASHYPSQTLNTNEIQHQYLTFQTEVATRPIFPADNVTRQIPPFPNLKEFDEPYTWSLTRKRLMTWLACSVNIIAAYAAGSYASPAEELEQEWHVSYVAYNVGITLFTIGFAIAPMVLAPFSEINGRRPVFVASGILFVICQMWCALSPSYGSILVARFFLGIGGSTFSTMVGGILADIWLTKDRNTPMVVFTGATLFGTGLGPLVSGVVTQHLGWRWVFYIQIITSGTLVALVTIFFKETRGSVLLSRKAKALNKWYEELETVGALGVVTPTSSCLTPFEQPVNTSDQQPSHMNDNSEKSLRTSSSSNSIAPSSPPPIRLRYLVLADEERATILKMISLSLYRPFHMLLTEPVVFWFSLWIAFSWSVLYLQFGSVPLVFATNHGFTLAQTGYLFASMMVGAIVMTILSIYQDNWAVRKFPNTVFGGASPEGRLYFTCVQSALMPIGLFWFGWTCYADVHWIVPTIAVGVATMGIFSIFLAVFNYSADVYRTYASSALAASGLCRNLLAGCFPLVTRQMFTGLGFQGASSLLGGIGLALTLVPWVLVFFGPKIRKRSRIARQFVEEDEKRNQNENDGNEIEESADKS